MQVQTAMAESSVLVTTFKVLGEQPVDREWLNSWQIIVGNNHFYEHFFHRRRLYINSSKLVKADHPDGESVVSCVS